MKIKCVLASCVLFFAPWSHALDLVDALQRAKVNDPNWQANLLQYEADQLMQRQLAHFIQLRMVQPDQGKDCLSDAICLER